MPQHTELSPEERLRAVYETAESRTAKAFEDAVATPSFGALLARSAENVAAVTRLSADFADLVLRNLRLAGRADVTRLARQLHRTEDKLERVLQEVEALRDELARRDAADERERERNREGNGESGREDEGEPDRERASARGRSASASRSRTAGSSPATRSGNGRSASTPRRRESK